MLNPPQPSTPGGPRRSRRRVALGVAAVSASALVAGWVAAFAWGNGEAGRAFLQARAEAALRARLGPVSVGKAGLDLLLRARLGPVTVPASRPGAPPLLRAESLLVRPRLASLLAGRIEPASIVLQSVHLAPGPGGEDLRRAFEGRGATSPRSGPAPAGALPVVHLHELYVALARPDGRPPLEVGPFDLDVEARRDPGGVSGRVLLGLPGGGHLEVEVGRDPGGATLRADGTVRLPADLPPELASALPVLPETSSLRIRATGQAAEGWRSGSVDVELATRDLSLSGPRVGPVPIGPSALRASGRISWDAKAGRISLQDGAITLGESGEVTARVSGEASLRGERPFSVTARTDPIPWQALVAALPPELAPPPSAPPVSGSLAARLSVSGPLGRRAEWDVQADLDLDDLRRASRAAGPTWLSSGFSWKPIDPAPGEAPRRIAVGPGNTAFVPYAEIPQTLVRAVTASEDAGFFGHRGFDFREMANAVAERGRVRGASTITQQLAKNLFLSPERTLARKIREALGTIALEATLSKARILEIYLNIAEWGPGVYGVGEAARFWFGKDARQLSPRESAFLATVIPSPRRFAARLHRSGITPWWNARIDDVLGKMRIQNQLTDEQLAAALAEPLAPLASALAAPGGESAGSDAGAEADPGPEPGPDDDGPASGGPSRQAPSR